MLVHVGWSLRTHLLLAESSLTQEHFVLAALCTHIAVGLRLLPACPAVVFEQVCHSLPGCCKADYFVADILPLLPRSNAATALLLAAATTG